ncbi:MAG: DUF169 domain-containing protein [Coriobacteriales bacterium]|jgi:uncharacterized protein (DUF169 family)/NAD-dependent dihydropyrimidine dehydrogenase PreA subunit|nr:DUF169 domain-containing protein [Coriobacteriales bacterium]
MSDTLMSDAAITDISMSNASKKDSVQIIDQSASRADSTPDTVSYRIDIDAQKCVGCGLCEAFCPVEVFAMRAAKADHVDNTSNQESAGRSTARPVAEYAELCWGCETCAGQCPQKAIRVVSLGGAGLLAGRELAKPLAAERKLQLAQWSQALINILGLRWNPVAISLIPAGDPLPDVPVPEERLRYCQSLMAARRGVSLMLPANRHACPDGTSILGLTAMPAKLASGELYILFHKLHDIKAAQHMVHERPMLPERSIDATVVTPLDKAACEPQVVAIAALPEQVMWLLMSSSYYSGHRHDLHASGYNAQCVETTLLPLTTGEINVSFGCYGCRAASDVGDDLMFIGIPIAQMPTVIAGLTELSKKAIVQSRSKVYLPPMA